MTTQTTQATSRTSGMAEICMALTAAIDKVERTGSPVPLTPEVLIGVSSRDWTETEAKHLGMCILRQLGIAPLRLKDMPEPGKPDKVADSSLHGSVALFNSTMRNYDDEGYHLGLLLAPPDYEETDET